MEQADSAPPNLEDRFRGATSGDFYGGGSFTAAEAVSVGLIQRKTSLGILADEEWKLVLREARKVK